MQTPKNIAIRVSNLDELNKAAQYLSNLNGKCKICPSLALEFTNNNRYNILFYNDIYKNIDSAKSNYNFPPNMEIIDFININKPDNYPTEEIFRAYKAGKTLEFQSVKGGGEWETNHELFDSVVREGDWYDYNFRVKTEPVDPFQVFKDAEKEGKKLQVKIPYCNLTTWADVSCPHYVFPPEFYRIKPEEPPIDPYQSLKDAYMAGKIIQYNAHFGTSLEKWIDISNIRWHGSVDAYRIKPESPIDPYKIFKDAQEIGKTIQWFDGTNWIDTESPCYYFEPKDYRIKLEEPLQEIAIAFKFYTNKPCDFNQLMEKLVKAVDEKFSSFNMTQNRNVNKFPF